MAEPLTAEETAELTVAMFELAEAGKHDAAEHLGELAQDPDAVRKVLGREMPEKTGSAEK